MDQFAKSSEALPRSPLVAVQGLRKVLMALTALFSSLSIICDAVSLAWTLGSGKGFGFGWREASAYSLFAHGTSLACIAALYILPKTSLTGSFISLERYGPTRIEWIVVAVLVGDISVDVVVHTVVERSAKCAQWGSKCRAFRAATVFTWLAWCAATAVCVVDCVVVWRSRR